MDAHPPGLMASQTCQASKAPLSAGNGPTDAASVDVSQWRQRGYRSECVTPTLCVCVPVRGCVSYVCSPSRCTHARTPRYAYAQAVGAPDIPKSQQQQQHQQAGLLARVDSPAAAPVPVPCEAWVPLRHSPQPAHAQIRTDVATQEGTKGQLTRQEAYRMQLDSQLRNANQSQRACVCMCVCTRLHSLPSLSRTNPSSYMLQLAPGMLLCDLVLNVVSASMQSVPLRQQVCVLCAHRMFSLAARD